MTEYEKRGRELRDFAKAIVLDYMKSTYVCAPGEEGIRQAELFRKCGFDWGDFPNVTSSQQQFWIVALLRELQSEGIVERVGQSGPWRLKK